MAETVRAGVQGRKDANGLAVTTILILADIPDILVDLLEPRAHRLCGPDRFELIAGLGADVGGLTCPDSR